MRCLGKGCSHKLSTIDYKKNRVEVGLSLLVICSIVVICVLNNSVAEPTGYARRLLERKREKIPYYKRRPEVADINCKRLFDDDKEYIKRMKRLRRVINTRATALTCEAIRNRVIGEFPTPNISYPLAIARNVYRDYEFLEQQLSVSYSAESSFCYSIDSKAPKWFRLRMKALSSCISNVYVAQESRDIDSNGHNTNAAHMRCLELLLEKNEDWRYAILLQNNEMVLQSNSELARVFQMLNGSNDISISFSHWERIDREKKWDVGSLRMFKNETPLSPEERFNAKLEFAKGYVHSSLSREAVDWAVNSINTTILMDQLNDVPYGADEQLWNTLHISETLQMPGGFHSACLKRGISASHLTVFAQWGGDCKTGNRRHGICIFGVEDLPQIQSHFRARKLFLNKVLPEFDFGVISCMAERIFNDTHFGDGRIFDDSIIQNSLSVNYHKSKREPGFNVTDYKCMQKD